MLTVQATILNQLGLNPFEFGFESGGLNNRLIGPTDEAKVLTKILA